MAAHPHSRPGPKPSGRVVSDAAFAAALDAHFPSPPEQIAVAVSGGADSLALVRLAATWAAKRGVKLTALTVDHRLRDAATTEAVRVGQWLSGLGIAHRVLTWTDGENVRHLSRSAQDAARKARYELLTQWCHANACRHLMLAHHADDQIETFLMRLARGSGVYGLAAMDARTEVQGIAVLRPLLDFAKADLEATCVALGQAWIDDPSNRDSKYMRTRFRQSRALLAAEGLSDERLLATIAHLQRARDAIAHAVHRLESDVCIWSSYGTATLWAQRLFAAPDEVSLRVLSDVLCRAGGQVYGPRFESLHRLHQKLKAEALKPVTLHGCCIMRVGDVVSVTREASAIRDVAMLPVEGQVAWDGRFGFSITAPAARPPGAFRVRAYQSDDKTWWKAHAEGATLDDIPARVRRTLPVFEDEKGVAGMPHLGLWRADVAGFKTCLRVHFLNAKDRSAIDKAELLDL